ncbi:MAG: sulfate ABC transporter permease subunit CysT [Verrucomicrobiales bacterium]|jgi:sulfate transport system permease protein|nr:sulfate ABC transporter permease subunit CysT [Verrucomicrobiales bacterium]
MIRNRKPTLPGFKLTLGLTILFVSLVILFPLSALTVKASSLGFKDFLSLAFNARTLSSYYVTFGCAFGAMLIDLVFGLLLAWILTRYSFPGKNLLDIAMDLPFTLPTAVAGISLAAVFGAHGWLGQWLEPLGIKVAYTPLGVTLAMAFVSLPFVVRTVQPVLQELDREVEEAATTLGGSPIVNFWKIIFPEIRSPALVGASLAYIRGLGEFGAVIYIAGNLPFHTEITSLLIYIRLDEHDYPSAAAIAMVMLAVSLVLLLALQAAHAYSQRYLEKSA